MKLKFKKLTNYKHGDSLNNKNNASSKKKCIISGITGIIIGTVITGGIGVAAVTLMADQVKYIPSNEKFNVSNTKEALDEIYKIAEYEVPSDTYFYNSKTKGESIVRYKKVDGKFYLCDENGSVTNENEQDVTGLTLVEYTSATAVDLNIGKAGYSLGSFYLGDGTSNSKDYIVTGTLTAAANQFTKVDLGFKPNRLVMFSTKAQESLDYDIKNNTLYYSNYVNDNNKSYHSNRTSNYSKYFMFDDTGFNFKPFTTGFTGVYYIAVK